MLILSAVKKYLKSPFSQKRNRNDLEDGISKSTFPFGSRLHITWPRMIQIGFGTVFLVPLRVIILSITGIISYLMAKFLIAFSKEEELLFDFKKKWQKNMISILQGLGRFQMMIVSIFMKVSGEPADKNTAPMLVLAPHSTFLDSIFIFCHPTIPCPISSIDNKEIFGFGTLLRVCKPIFVTRTEITSRQNCVEQLCLRANNPEKYGQTMVFPEGTNGNRKALLLFKPGAFIPGVPVQPVVFRFKMWDTITWTFDGQDIPLLVFLTLCGLYTHIEFQYLPVYYPNQREKSDPMLFADNVRDVMAHALNIPVTSLTYENGCLFDLAIKLKLPPYIANFNYHESSKSSGYNLGEYKRRLKEFSVLRSTLTNEISLESIQKSLFIPPSKFGNEFFESLEISENKSLNFLQYVLITSKILKCDILCYTVENIFQCFNLSCAEELSECDFDKVFCVIFEDISQNQRDLISHQCWKKLSNSKKTIPKSEFISVLTKQPLYIYFFNIVSKNPPKLLVQKLQTIIQ